MANRTMVGRLRVVVVVAALALIGSACGVLDEELSENAAPPPPDGLNAGSDTAETVGADQEPAGTKTVNLDTPCFSLSTGLVVPSNHIASDVSPNQSSCHFVLQAEGLADTTVIAGELFTSSKGRSFDEFVADIEQGLARGQELDLLPLQRLNSGASGRDLPITNRQDLSSPNRAVIFTHESDRRTGFVAHSAAVAVPTAGAGPTQVIYIWGLSTPVNDQLIIDLINAMQVRAVNAG